VDLGSVVKNTGMEKPLLCKGLR